MKISDVPIRVESGNVELDLARGMSTIDQNADLAGSSSIDHLRQRQKKSRR
jgi:hypothetical protein